MKKQITLKHDVAANWAKAVNFIPKVDELILYDGVIENGVYVELPRLKQGDGKTKVNDLPFLDSINSTNEISYLYYDDTLELF
jgi:Mrp family chromosome partitioning ATPase